MLKKLLITSVSATLIAGCGSDDNSTSNNTGNTPDNGMKEDAVTLLLKTAGQGEPEYLIRETDLTSEVVSAQGVGEEQIGWNFYYKVGDTLFVTGYDESATTSYHQADDGSLTELNTFLFDKPLEVFGQVNDSTLLATHLPRSGEHVANMLYVVDASNGRATAKIPYTIDDNDTGVRGQGTVAAPSAIQVRGDKLFIAYHKLDDSEGGSAFQTPEQDTAFIAVYDYPLTANAAPEKLISDNRTSHIGVNGNPTNMIQLANGDIYTMSNGGKAAGFTSNSEKPSGILRIKNGTTEFDDNYFLNISEKTNGGRIFWFSDIGDNKVLARIQVPNDAADEAPWSAFGKSFHTMKLVLIDLQAETVTDVNSVPLHQKRWTAPLEVFDGKVYLSIETEQENYIYQYDIATNSAIKGSQFVGKTIKGFFNL